MKIRIRTVLAAALLTALATPSIAARIGAGAVVGPAEPEKYGTYVATVRYINPHYGPDGMYYTYSYLQISATTMSYCQSQLSTLLAQPNVSVVTWCHQQN